MYTFHPPTAVRSCLATADQPCQRRQRHLLCCCPDSSLSIPISHCQRTSGQPTTCIPFYFHSDPKRWVNPKKERKRRREAAESGETRRSKKKSAGSDDEGEDAEAEAAAMEDKYLKAYAERGSKRFGVNKNVRQRREEKEEKKETTRLILPARLLCCRW